MSDEKTRPNVVEALGERVLGAVRYGGSMTLLLGSTLRWTLRAAVAPARRSGRAALADQIIRLGLGSATIVLLVQLCIGVILALQMTPPLEPLGQADKVAKIIGFAGFRMLGPIITAVVLSGFAGASIAAELGTMAVAEEIEALEATAINPVRFLVVPRMLATVAVTVLLTIGADLMIALGGWFTSRLVLGPASYVGYWDRMKDQLEYKDFITGLIQAAVFGLLISIIACHEGLKVRCGAEGVGRATTMTVVYSIVAIVSAACVCTMIFYVFGL